MTIRELLRVLPVVILGTAAVIALPWLLVLGCVGFFGPAACF